MLLRLMWRDWVLNRPALVPVLLVFAAFQVFAVQFTGEVPRLPLLFGCPWMCVMTMVPFIREHQFRAISWSCTLPATRADLMKARYLGSWLLVATALLLVGAGAVLVPGSASFMAPSINFDAPLAVAAVVTVFIALMFPPVARFGPKGAAFLLIAINFLMPAVFVVSKVTGTQDDVEGVVLGAFASVVDQAAQVKAAMSAPVFYVAFVAALVIVNAISCRFAVALFRNREL